MLALRNVKTKLFYLNDRIVDMLKSRSMRLEILDLDCSKLNKEKFKELLIYFFLIIYSFKEKKNKLFRQVLIL